MVKQGKLTEGKKMSDYHLMSDEDIFEEFTAITTGIKREDYEARIGFDNLPMQSRRFIFSVEIRDNYWVIVDQDGRQLDDDDVPLQFTHVLAAVEALLWMNDNAFAFRADVRPLSYSLN